MNTNAGSGSSYGDKLDLVFLPWLLFPFPVLIVKARTWFATGLRPMVASASAAAIVGGAPPLIRARTATPKRNAN
jgi:hypothetical protein